eukprot:641306-Prymnesium_polylepis.1
MGPDQDPRDVKRATGAESRVSKLRALRALSLMEASKEASHQHPAHVCGTCAQASCLATDKRACQHDLVGS